MRASGRGRPRHHAGGRDRLAGASMGSGCLRRSRLPDNRRGLQWPAVRRPYAGREPESRRLLHERWGCKRTNERHPINARAKRGQTRPSQASTCLTRRDRHSHPALRRRHANAGANHVRHAGAARRRHNHPVRRRPVNLCADTYDCASRLRRATVSRWTSSTSAKVPAGGGSLALSHPGPAAMTVRLRRVASSDVIW